MNWDEGSIPDLSGKTAIVTGANAGLGRETARMLAEHGAKVILAVRDVGKGDKVAADIRRAAPVADLSVEALDLGDLASVGAFADRMLARHDRLDLLINNAGVMLAPPGKTADGFDTQFGVNHLGHFALTGRLTPLLYATPDARVVTVSSLAHKSGKLDLDDPNWMKRKYNRGVAYSDSKLANLYFTYEFGRRAEAAGRNIRVVAAHPGWTASDLARHSGLMGFIHGWIGQKTMIGALPTIRAAVDPDARSGDYYGPSGRMEIRGSPVKVASTPKSHDREAAARLWTLSEQLTGISY